MYLVMTSVTFCLSICISEEIRLGAYRRLYRLLGALTLILFLGAGAVWADTTEEDWPDQIDFPQNKSQTLPSPPSQFQVQGGSSAGSSGPVSVVKPKKRLHFKSLTQKKDNRPVLTEDQIVNVGPRDVPAKADPLLRLSIPVETDSGRLVPAGIYILQPVNTENADSGQERLFSLSQRNRVVMQLKAHSVGAEEDNFHQTGTASPISKLPSKEPPSGKAEARLSEDLKSVTFIYQQGGSRYESDPYPVAVDRRPTLGF